MHDDKTHPFSHTFAVSRRVRWLCLCLCVICFFSSLSALGQESSSNITLKSASEKDYPPFCVIDHLGDATGFSVELLKAAARKMGREVSFETGTWSEVKDSLVIGRVDCLPLVGRTPEREAIFDFTFPYLTLHGAVFVRNDNKTIKSFSDLKAGHKVAVMQADNAEEFLRREPREFEIVSTRDFGDALRGLSQGDYDAVVIQRLLALRLIKEEGLTNLRALPQPLEDFKQEFCFAVTEGDREVLAILNEGLAIVMADGTFRRLYQRWLGSETLPVRHKIIIGGDHAYPPYEYLDENGQPTGYNVALSKALARKLNLDVEIRLGPWGEIRQSLEDGEIDLIHGMFYSTEREKTFDFSPPHTVIDHVAVSRKGKGFGPAPNSVDELLGKSIVVMRGDIMHDYAIENGLRENLTAVETQENALQLLADGRYDCALVARLPALFWIKDHGWDNLDVSDVPLLAPQYCYAATPQNAVMLNRVIEGLKALEASGELFDIKREWLGVASNGKPGIAQTIRSSAIIIIPLILLMMLMIYWARVLYRRLDSQSVELRRSQKLLRTAFDQSEVGIMIASARAGHAEYINPAGSRILGTKTRDELVTKDYSEELSDLRFFDMDGNPLESTDLPLAMAIATGLPQQREIAIKHSGKDELQYLLADSAPIFDDHDNVEAGMVIFQDITESRKNAERLRIANETLERSAVVAFLWDTSTTEWPVVYVSENVEKLFGWAAQDFYDGTVTYRDVIHPDDRNRVEQEALEGHNDKNIPKFEHKPYRIVRKDKSIIWVDDTTTVQRDEDGRPVRTQGVVRDCTRRVEAEQSLARSEERLSLALDAANDGIWDWNLLTDEVYFSPRYLSMLGYAPNAFPHSLETFKKLLHPDDAEWVMEVVGKHVDKRDEGFLIEFRMRNADDEYQWIMGRGQAVARDENGKTTRMVGTHTDISQRKEAESSLLKQSRFEQGIAAASSCLLKSDAKEDVIDEAIEHLRKGADVGRVYIFENYTDPQGELCMRQTHEVCASDVKPEIDNPTLQHIPYKEGFQRWQNKLSQNKAVWGNVADFSESERAILELQNIRSIVVVPLSGHGIWRGFIGFDETRITRKWQENEISLLRTAAESIYGYMVRQEFEENLSLALNLQQTIFDGSMVGILMIGQGRKIIKANKRLCEILGYESTDIIGQSTRIIHVDENAYHKFGERWLPLINRGHHIKTEYAFRHRDGHPIDCFISGKSVNPADSEQGIIWIVQDISEQKKMQDEREMLEEQYRQSQKMEAIGQLTGGVAHDFNNLLQVINGFTGMALEMVDDDSPVQPSLLEVAKAGQRAAKLVEHLLLFSRRQVMRPEQLDLNETVGDLLKMLGRVIGEDVRLEWVPGNALGIIWADRGMIEQVVMNVAINARDAMPGGGTLTLETHKIDIDDKFALEHEWAEPGQYIQLIMADTGSGIFPELLEKIFDPFFSTKEKGKGTGLGLSTVYGIVRQHDGLIHVESEPNKGTKINTYWPRLNAVQIENQPQISAAEKQTGGTETILLAEDDQMVANLARLILQRSGYKVITAENGREAVEIFKEKQDEIDLLLFDVVMPEKTGYEAWQEICEIDPDIKTIFASGYSEDALHNRFVLKESINLVHKPFSTPELLQKVREILDENA